MVLRDIYRPSPARLVLAALCAGSLGAASVAQEPAGQADAYAELRDLLEAAPNRQVGQPGNAAVDRMIAERFAEAVAAHNDPQAWRRAKGLAEKADKAELALLEARQRAQVTTSGGAVIASHFLVRMTLEKPWRLVAFLVAAAAALAATWWAKRRRSLAVAGGVVIGTALLLPIAAALVDTRAERAASEEAGAAGPSVQTKETLERAVVVAARRALEADIRAAEALRGLWQCGRITFPSAAFVPGRATLVVGEYGEDGRVVPGRSGPRLPAGERQIHPPVAGVRTARRERELRLYQMSPNLVEPANLPESGYEGRLTYAGKARPEDLAGKELDGAAVLVDFDSGNRWLDAAQLGAEVVIVLEPPSGTPATFSQAAQKITTSPLSIPRYYLRREDFRAAFGEEWLAARLPVVSSPQAAELSSPKSKPAAGTKVSIRASAGRWERVELATDWLFVPGTAESLGPEAPLPEDPSRQLVHIQAYKDSASIVPELSPGAGGAANLVLLLRLLKRLERDPPVRPVLFSVVNDHANALNGEQEYAFAAFAEPGAIRDEMDEIDRELARQLLIERVFGLSWPPTSEFMEDLRSRLETVGGRVFTVKQPAVDRLQRFLNAAREERNRLTMYALFQLLPHPSREVAAHYGR